MTNTAACAICSLHRELDSTADDGKPRHGATAAPAGLLILRQGPWLLRHHPLPAPMAGWLLLDSRRHLGGAADLEQAEAASLGPMLQRCCALVRQLCGCDRVYTIGFGEGARHLHLHLIPRHGQDPDSESWKVADLYRAVACGTRAPADPDAVLDLVQRARQHCAGWEMEPPQNPV